MIMKDGDSFCLLMLVRSCSCVAVMSFLDFILRVCLCVMAKVPLESWIIFIRGGIF